MTENNKPEWFEITDSDEKPQLRKVSKSLPISGVLVAAMILGVGGFVSQSPDLAPVSSATAAPEENVGVQSAATSPADSSVKSAIANPATVATIGAVAVATTALANPSIATLPTGNDDDDDDDDDEEDDDDDDDDDDEEDDD
jgi:ribosomal protein L12E/L44/L45/RPP1/RPP2